MVNGHYDVVFTTSAFAGVEESGRDVQWIWYD